MPGARAFTPEERHVYDEPFTPVGGYLPKDGGSPLTRYLTVPRLANEYNLDIQLQKEELISCTKSPVSRQSYQSAGHGRNVTIFGCVLPPRLASTYSLTSSGVGASGGKGSSGCAVLYW